LSKTPTIWGFVVKKAAKKQISLLTPADLIQIKQPMTHIQISFVNER
jgi:hypothetical protein